MTAVKYTMTPEETARWTANPLPIIRRDSILADLTIAEPLPRGQHLGSCGHPTTRGSDLCRECWSNRPRKENIGECGHRVSTSWTRMCGDCRLAANTRRRAEKAEQAKTKRPPVLTSKPQPVRNIEDLIDLAWDERPHMTRDAVATLVRRELRQQRLAVAS